MAALAQQFGVLNDDEYSATHKRSRITVWSGPWYATFEAEGYSLPHGDGYMLTTYNGDKLRVECELRDETTWEQTDATIGLALADHYVARGLVAVGS